MKKLLYLLILLIFASCTTTKYGYKEYINIPKALSIVQDIIKDSVETEIKCTEINNMNLDNNMLKESFLRKEDIDSLKVFAGLYRMSQRYDLSENVDIILLQTNSPTYHEFNGKGRYLQYLLFFNIMNRCYYFQIAEYSDIIFLLNAGSCDNVDEYYIEKGYRYEYDK